MGKKKNSVLITGVCGQDGSYMAELCVANGLQVHGLARATLSPNLSRLANLIDNKSNSGEFNLHFGDITDSIYIRNLLEDINPDFVFNFAAQSHVKISFQLPELTFNVNTLGYLNILNSLSRFKKETFLYQASSSELFGDSPPPQAVTTSFSPVSPYAISKLSSHLLKESYQSIGSVKICNGILFNHESFRRSEYFVTKKIVKNAVRIKNEILIKKNNSKTIGKLRLGNLDAKRDWGWAPEYMIGVFQRAMSGDNTQLFIGTGESASVRQFASRVFQNFDLELQDWLYHDNNLIRISEVNHLEAKKSDVKKSLGWLPQYNWESLCDLMCEEELIHNEKKINWVDLLSERS